NHVRVNGSLIEPGEAGKRPLVDGDVILLGGFDLRFVRDDDERVVLADDARAGGNTQRVTQSTRMEDLTALIQAPTAEPLPKEAEEAIERAKKAVTVLSGLAQRIAALSPDADILDAIMALVFEATPAERAALFLWDAEAGRLIAKRSRTRSGGEAQAMSV